MLEIVARTNITSNLKFRPYLRKDDAGFVPYTLTRTSDVYDQKASFGFASKSQHASQVSKYQISTAYNLDLAHVADSPAKCIVEFQEFLIKFNSQSLEENDIVLVGRKQMLLS